jgi:hypothetical protein
VLIGAATSTAITAATTSFSIGHVERYAYTNRPTLLFSRGKYMRGEPLLPP